jgi:hypothetical protein
VHVREPYWDPDLVDFLVRVRPQARSVGGMAKALVRRPLTRRFPELGFERQRKSWMGRALQSVLESQTAAARQAVGPLRNLVELGVIDDRQLATVTEDALAGRASVWRLGWAWEALNLEQWLRVHR